MFSRRCQRDNNIILRKNDLWPMSDNVIYCNKSNAGGDVVPEASPLRRFIPNRAAHAHAITVGFSVSAMPLFRTSGYKSLDCTEAAYTSARYKRGDIIVIILARFAGVPRLHVGFISSFPKPCSFRKNRHHINIQIQYVVRAVYEFLIYCRGGVPPIAVL